MTKIRSIRLIILFSFCWMQSSFPLNGVPHSARSLALSGGGAAIKSSMLTKNPASLDVMQPSLDIHTQYHPVGIGLAALSIKYPLKKMSLFGKIANIDFGSLKDGISSNSFSAGDLLLMGGIKTTVINAFSMGMNVNYGFSKIDDAISQSATITCGFRTELTESRLGFGVSFENMGLVYDAYGNTDDELSRRVRLAGYFLPRYLPAVIFSDIISESQINGIQLISGIELLPRINLTLRFSISALIEGSPVIGGVAFGAQLQQGNWKIDFASRNLLTVGFINGVSVGRIF